MPMILSPVYLYVIGDQCQCVNVMTDQGTLYTTVYTRAEMKVMQNWA